VGSVHGPKPTWFAEPLIDTVSAISEHRNRFDDPEIWIAPKGAKSDPPMFPPAPVTLTELDITAKPSTNGSTKLVPAPAT
jgi:hypothetical protein